MNATTQSTTPGSGADAAPVPFRFELPSPLWQPTDPETVGVTNALFFALRADDPADPLAGSYTPSLTISGGWRDPGTTVAQVAEESLEKLRIQGLSDVEVVRRREVESDHAPALAQTIGGLVDIDGTRFDIRQQQAVFGYRDLTSNRIAIVIHTLTSTYAQEADLESEWRSYVASIEVVVDGGDATA
ncbi:hypothetical protein [Nocardioides sp. R-C-SC26]|uniref:hypothetical protein n=1 Tax=Nocardioides sp. R-C-SC26 TaxID=2870414 RepID=UPI001E61F5F0|nr:hypothetical protein [Nocardioides sp. R-C-SC26]